MIPSTVFPYTAADFAFRQPEQQNAALRTAAAPETQLDRIERKLDKLIEALADEIEDGPMHTLDGSEAGAERDQSQPL